jgi:hypothetical protein
MYHASFLVLLNPFCLWSDGYTADLLFAGSSFERPRVLADGSGSLFKSSASLRNVFVAGWRRYLCLDRKLSILIGNATGRQRGASCRGGFGKGARHSNDEDWMSDSWVLNSQTTQRNRVRINVEEIISQVLVIRAVTVSTYAMVNEQMQNMTRVF